MSRRVIYECDRCGKPFDGSPLPPITPGVQRETDEVPHSFEVLVRTHELGEAIGAAVDDVPCLGSVVSRRFDDLCEKCQNAVAGYLARIFKINPPKNAADVTEEDELEAPPETPANELKAGDGELPLVGA